ncbi:MAG: glycosyltransferase family 2 protein, partial [Candidatus Omnitrophica bacterium]|nr:glycosyltransferase family 2 protein [Candidatus Omnitrophota bacterium]
SKYERRYWTDIFERTYQSKIDTWDYQMFYACWIHGGLAIQPNSNLISNIGFADPYATHAFNKSPYAGLPVTEIPRVDHPLHIERHKEADDFAFDHVFGGKWMKEKSSFRGRLRGVKEKFEQILRRPR